MESKICRVCLDRTATISLFDKVDEVQFRDKIMKCVGVSIEEGDGLPDGICESCAAELAVSYEFAVKCAASDRALRCLGLLHACPAPLKEEAVKAEPKLEPSPNYIIQEYQQFTEETLVGTGDYVENNNVFNNEDGIAIDEEAPSIQKSDGPNMINEDDLQAPEIQKFNKRKKKLQEKYIKPLPNHLRKYKPRVYSGPIQCMACGRVLKCHSAYEQHMLTHTKEKPFTCDLCKKNFRTKSSMKRHIYNHYGIDLLELRKLRPLPDWDGRKKRSRPHSSPVLCVVCGLKVKSQSALESHMRKHTGDKPFSCPNCNKCFTLKASLRRHIDSYHNEFRDSRFVCEHCGKNFYNKSSIIIHLRIHTGEKPYQCPFCKQGFAQISQLIRHKRGHTGEKPFACETCDKAFRDRTLLNKHRSVHSDARDFVCHICSKALKTRQALRVHIGLHNNPGRFGCGQCAAVFTLKGNLTNHVGRMHSERAGTCPACARPVADLEGHLRAHRGEKPYVCKLCQQGFVSRRGMSQHIGFKHRDSAKFKCTTGQCDKAFPTISMLEFHVLKAHLADTPYVCAHCARGFLRPCDLSRHLRFSHMDHSQVKSQFIKTVQISDSV